MNRSFAVTALLAVLACSFAVPLASAQKNKDRTLTIDANPNPITWGSATTLSGRLTNPSTGGVKVDLERNPFPLDDNNFIATGVSTTTAPNGGYSFEGVKPKSHSEYRAVARTKPAERSPSVLVKVRKKISFRVNTLTPDSGSKVKFYGRVCPPHDLGLVKIQRRTDEGSWKSIRKVALVDDPKVANCSRYKIYITVKSDAVFRAVALKDADHSIGKSGRRTLDVE